MFHLRSLSILAFLLLQAFTNVSRSQNTPADAPLPDRKEWLMQRGQEFASYDMKLQSLSPVSLKFETTPLLDWSNPERGTFFGATFLWTNEGRPELLANAYGRGRWLRHEFHSLSTEPIQAARSDNPVHRFPPGIEWRQLDGAPEPATSYALRLTQLRRQAERFQVTMIVRRPVETHHTLRLLGRPIFRSPESAPSGVAVFVFVQGTDPECALLIEIASDKSWRYAFARQTSASLDAHLDGRQVLILAGQPQLRDPQSPYIEITPPEAKAAP
jgi:hypothetical protein